MRIIYTPRSLITTTTTILVTTTTTIPITTTTTTVVPLQFGLLYNYYAATDSRNIANTGWHLSSYQEWETLRTYLGGATFGYKLKETGTTWWETPNTSATNEVNFNARGSADRAFATGTFGVLKRNSYYWTSGLVGNSCYLFTLAYNSANLAYTNPDTTTTERNRGSSIRLVKDSTILTHGQTGTYTGNNGKVYGTICIDTQEWLAGNLAETKYRNGDSITEVTDNSAWVALSSEALCSYGNNWGYV